MRYTDIVFDLYGTLVDIHTEENDPVWDKTALYFGFHGARYTGKSLRTAFEKAMRDREARAGQNYECYPDIPFEQIMAELFTKAGVTDDVQSLGVNAAQLFRICSLEYIRVYPCAVEALEKLRSSGLRLWLLSNAQAVFTGSELKLLGLGPQFNGVLLSSDYGFRKPDIRFYRALVDQHHLDPKKCLMIGNDRETDIAGAQNAGMATLYMHTALTPEHQLPAAPSRAIGTPQPDGHYEYEGEDWSKLVDFILKIAV